MTIAQLEDHGLKKICNYAELSFFIKNSQHPDERVKISIPSLAHDFARNLFGMDIETKEMFFAIMLNNKGEVIGVYKVSSGGINHCLIDVRLIFCAALNCLATQMIVCHNHPSGNRNPSKNDIDITIRLRDAGRLLDIELLDHLIITEHSYTSLKSDGEF